MGSHAPCMLEINKSELERLCVVWEIVENDRARIRVSFDGVEWKSVDEINNRHWEAKIVHVFGVE